MMPSAYRKLFEAFLKNGTIVLIKLFRIDEQNNINFLTSCIRPQFIRSNHSVDYVSSPYAWEGASETGLILYINRLIDKNGDKENEM